MRPGCSRSQTFVYALHVADTLVRQPSQERIDTSLRVVRDAILPVRAPTQHAREMRPGLRSHFQRRDELSVADTGAEVNVWLPGGLAGNAKPLHGFTRRVRT